MITLQQQIEAQEGFARTCDLGRLDMANALLASLRRLKEIEQQKPVSWQFYQNDQWSHGSEHHNHRENTEQGGIPVRELYAMPASQDGYKELCRRLYVELFHCNQQMMQATDEDGEPMWTEGKTVVDVLANSKAMLAESEVVFKD